MKLTGNDQRSAGSADQIDATWGTIRRSTK